nr:hypothetical protein [uncultured bacterium]
MTEPPDSASGGRTPLTWRVEQNAAATIVHIEGEIDIASEPAFVEAVERGLDTSTELVVVNLTDVAFMGSSGLRTLLQARLQAVDRGRILRIAAGNADIQRVLDISGLNNVLPVFTTVEHALAP